MPTITTIGGWAAILAITGTYYWVNKQRKQKNLRALNPKLSSKGAESRKHTKVKKGKKDGALSGSEASQKKKVQQPAQPAAQQPIANVSDLKKADRDEKDDDRKFALQMANTKRGVADAPKSQNSTRTKSVKQTKAQEKSAVELPSESGTAPSSTTGVDADDDQSPINSPELSAIATAHINGDVSDMLEKPTDGPSVLRVTAPINSQPKKAKKPQSFEVKETKKQKQNRKKAEEKKQAREEDEKARKVQLESHRRSVREAEGRAAKDGSTFIASQVPSSSAWTAAPAVQATNGNNIAPSKEVELLDTYEPTNGHVASKSIEEIYSESEIAGSKLEEELSRIPEEEQIRVAKEESGHWEEVKTKTRKNKVTMEAPNDTLKNVKSNKMDTSSSNDDSGDFGVPPVVEPTGPGKKWVQNVAYVAGNGKVVEREMEIQDSEWEVA
ncbi:hypothetical protein QTJ16_004417 [Diplocarpon rosae]|uniref:Uncharacterized protein n=1 Tax=Diplocarpon rosae TaxID=946125 RepID=A0AAD9SYW3_9HELO|nr:hypothetical protein QTJ16_004417 [Diplocarpon rosae]PBP19013.1 hypothetical protein BUE80_DR010151 [Diplocarpon rosae]